MNNNFQFKNKAISLGKPLLINYCLFFFFLLSTNDKVLLFFFFSPVLQWHALDRSEQAKYYEMARKEKELHMQLYPGWSARDNYASHTKKKKRKREVAGENKGNTTLNFFFLLPEKDFTCYFDFCLFLCCFLIIKCFFFQSFSFFFSLLQRP